MGWDVIQGEDQWPRRRHTSSGVCSLSSATPTCYSAGWTGGGWVGRSSRVTDGMVNVALGGILVNLLRLLAALSAENK